MNKLHTPRSLQRKHDLHADTAATAMHLFNSSNSFVLSSGALNLRIQPDSPYYTQIKDLLNNMAQDHCAGKIAAALLLTGCSEMPPHLLKAI